MKLQKLKEYQDKINLMVELRIAYDYIVEHAQKTQWVSEYAPRISNDRPILEEGFHPMMSFNNKIEEGKLCKWLKSKLDHFKDMDKDREYPEWAKKGRKYAKLLDANYKLASNVIYLNKIYDLL